MYTVFHEYDRTIGKVNMNSDVNKFPRGATCLYRIALLLNEFNRTNMLEEKENTRKITECFEETKQRTLELIIKKFPKKTSIV